jgi:hypothetical protein
MLKTTLALAIAAALNLAFIATPATAADVGATATHHIQAADKKAVKAAEATDDTAADEKPAKKAKKAKSGKAHKAKSSKKAPKKAKKAAE